MDNLISIQMTAEDKTAVQTALASLKEVLGKYLIAMTTEQKKGIVKISDKSMPFLEKIEEYVGSHPELVPSFMDINEFHRDLTATKELTEYLHEIQQIGERMTDTVTLTGSEAYKGGLTIYRFIQQAVKSNVADAKTIYEDLRKRFESQGPRKSKTTETPTS